MKILMDLQIICEKIIENYCFENKCLFANLRYFNPSGCIQSGLIGESFSFKDKSLMSNILRSLSNNKSLDIFGSNYNTKDGTAARDFVHIEDIAEGHISAMNYLNKQKKHYM